jgi:HEAT repeat protein
VPIAELWDRLLKDSEQNEGKHFGEFDKDVAGRLIEAIARHGDAAADLAMGRLAGMPGGDWMELHAIELLGKLRHAPAIDALLDRLNTPDDDYMPGRCAAALARIGTPEVVRKIEAFFPHKSVYCRMDLVDPLGKIKRPESEQTLIRLLATEVDDTVCAVAGAALCELCTTDGLETVRELIVHDRYDPQMAEVDELLVALCKMTGYAPPELADWTAAIADREVERQRRMKAYDAPGGAQALMRDTLQRLSGLSGGLDLDDNEEVDDGARDAGRDGRDMYDEDGIPLRGTIAPIVRDAPKVGRNDPCPCGSGKKYKKCCGG